MGRTDPVGANTERVGPYRIIGSLGRGGMGRLCAATREGVQGFEKVVALKWILPELANTPRFREMFLDEARTAAMLDHPSIVATYELGEFEGDYFIAMEYLPGEDLRAAITRARQVGEKIPVGLALSVATACARGLHFAHALTDRDGTPLSIVHRDVNPANIMLTYHGAVKVLDFGVARAKNRTLQTKTGGFKGKLRYASPEQLAGARVDRRADVFSLAIVLWETLTARPLFHADNELAVVDAVRSREIVRPSLLRHDVPEMLDRVLLRALHRDPTQRYDTANDFAEALEALDIERYGEQMIGRWLHQLFGADRAALKLDVARGHQVEGCVERLLGKHTDSSLDSASITGSLEPRTAWSTDLPWKDPVNEPAPPTDSIESPFAIDGPLTTDIPHATGVPRGVIGAIVAGAITIAAGGTFWMLSGDGTMETAVSNAATSLTLTTTPPGAQVFVDGEPTGLVTPTTMSGLRAHRAVTVRFVLPGHEALERQVEPGETIDVALRRDGGTLLVKGAPEGATLFVDGHAHGSERRIDLRVGPHHVWFEREAKIFWERDIAMSSKETVIDLSEATSRASGEETR